MPDRKMILTLAPGADIDELERLCAGLGLGQLQVLPNVGLAIGVGAAVLADALRKIPGVQAVEFDHTVSVSPPDADVQ